MTTTRFSVSNTVCHTACLLPNYHFTTSSRILKKIHKRLNKLKKEVQPLVLPTWEKKNSINSSLTGNIFPPQIYVLIMTIKQGDLSKIQLVKESYREEICKVRWVCFYINLSGYLTVLGYIMRNKHCHTHTFMQDTKQKVNCLSRQLCYTSALILWLAFPSSNKRCSQTRHRRCVLMAQASQRLAAR